MRAKIHRLFIAIYLPMVSASLEAKITDLGGAKSLKMENSKTMFATPGTAVFMPPEALGDRPV